ncbi:A24 family peptidase [Rhizobium sp. PAMB 3182]
MITAAIVVIFPLCLAIAAFSDLFTMTIPNRASAILLVTFLIVAMFLGLSWQQIGLHYVAGLCVFSVCFGLFAFNVMGGGDAKLLTAAAVWFGLTPSLMEFLIYVCYVGGAVTLLIVMLRSQANAIMGMGLSLPASILHAKKIPYGIAIGIGGFLAYPSSPLMLLITNGR